MLEFFKAHACRATLPLCSHHLGSIAVLVTLAGCATSMIDPQAVGNGQYLQIAKDTRVVAEMDTSNVGMMNCPNQAYMITQQTPALAGLIKCAQTPTTQVLPLSFTTHIQTNESDGYRRSSPYRTKNERTLQCLAQCLQVAREDSHC